MEAVAGQLEAAAVASTEEQRLILSRTRENLKGLYELGRKSDDESAISRVANVLGRYLVFGHDTATCELVLELLKLLSSDYQHVFGDHVLVAILPYTDPAAQPTTPGCSAMAAQLLEDQLTKHSRRSGFIIETLLKGHIRSRISKFRSGGLTPAGRKAEYEGAGHGVPGHGILETPSSSPWEGSGAPLIAVFRWAVEASDVSTTSMDQSRPKLQF
jgi:hypothetical protein